MAEAAETAEEEAPKYCEKHDDRIVEFYCKTCEEEICVKCAKFKKHKRHNVVNLAEAIAKGKAEIEALNAKIQGQLEEHQRHFREQEIEMRKKCADMRKQIEKRERDARAYVDTWLEYTKDQVAEIAEKYRQKYQSGSSEDSGAAAGSERKQESVDDHGARSSEHNREIDDLVEHLRAACSNGPPTQLPLVLSEMNIDLGEIVEVDPPGDVEHDLNAATAIMPDRERML